MRWKSKATRTASQSTSFVCVNSSADDVFDDVNHAPVDYHENGEEQRKMKSADHHRRVISGLLLAAVFCRPDRLRGSQAICVLFAQSRSASGRQGHSLPHYLSLSLSLIFSSWSDTQHIWLTAVLFIYHRSRVECLRVVVAQSDQPTHHIYWDQSTLIVMQMAASSIFFNVQEQRQDAS